MDVIIILIISSILFNYVHEFGHFLTANRVGMKVKRMYVAVGPKIRMWKDRHGTEMYLGMFPNASMQISSEEWDSHPAFNRLLVSSAGPAANFAMTFLLLAVAYVGFHTPTPASIDSVDAEGRGFTAGLRAGDLIAQVDGAATDTWTDVGLGLMSRVGQTGTISLDVLRDGETERYELAVEDWQSDVAWVDVFQYLGVTPAEPDQGAGGLFAGVYGAAVDSVRIFWSTAVAGIKMLFGELSVLNFGGGMQLTQLGIDRAELGVDDYLKLFALFSLGFGIINLLPGPIVDGLAMLTAAVEWVRRKEIPPAVMKIARPIGYVLAFGPIPLCIIHEILRLS